MNTRQRVTALEGWMDTRSAMMLQDVVVPISGGGTSAGSHTTLDSPVATVQEFLYRLSHGSLPLLFELLPARLERQMGRDALAAVLSSAVMRIRRRGGLRRVTCSGDAGEAREALVDISMTFADSTVDRSMLVVVHEEGRWRVDLMR